VFMIFIRSSGCCDDDLSSYFNGRTKSQKPYVPAAPYDLWSIAASMGRCPTPYRAGPPTRDDVKPWSIKSAPPSENRRNVARRGTQS
jgi:hypothetical protein